MSICMEQMNLMICTAELFKRNVERKWWPHLDSNQGPNDYESLAHGFIFLLILMFFLY